MDSFEPLINLLTILTVLSVAAERVTNILKLRHPGMCERQEDPARERERERRVHTCSLSVCLGVAVLMKADLFTILVNLGDPWSTIGWVQVEGDRWVRSPALASLGTFAYAVAGSILTGFALGFGSKFWHDLLGAVFELRAAVRRARPGPATP